MVDGDHAYIYRKLDKTPANAIHFPILQQGGIGMQRALIPQGHLMTPHWHPNANEIVYCQSGEGVVNIVIPNGVAQSTIKVYLFCQDDIVFLPQGYAHYFVNTGSDELNILMTFDNPNFTTFTLTNTLEKVPENIEIALNNSLSKKQSPTIIPYKKNT